MSTHENGDISWNNIELEAFTKDWVGIHNSIDPHYLPLQTLERCQHHRGYHSNCERGKGKEEVLETEGGGLRDAELLVPGRVRPTVVDPLQDAVLRELQQVVVEHFPELGAHLQP